MLLAVMTYARIESYRDFSGFKSQFEMYMRETERSYSNEIQEKRYQNTAASKRKPGPDPDNQKKESEKACSRISFYLFLNKKDRDSKLSQYQQLLELTKILMQDLYGEDEFLKKAEEKRPDFLDALLNALVTSADTLPKGITLASPVDLASLDLDDEEMNTVFYRMLKGTIEIDAKGTVDGYPSILEYITLVNKTKIRVYLASTPLLYALYGSPELVEEIKKERNTLYRMVKDEEIEKEQASVQFQDLFRGKQRPNFDDSILDFSISKSNPRDYD